MLQNHCNLQNCSTVEKVKTDRKELPQVVCLDLTEGLSNQKVHECSNGCDSGTKDLPDSSTSPSSSWYRSIGCSTDSGLDSSVGGLRVSSSTAIVSFSLLQTMFSLLFTFSVFLFVGLVTIRRHSRVSHLFVYMLLVEVVLGPA